MTLIMYVVTAIVLFYKSNLTIRAPVTTDGEGAVLISTTTLDSTVEDIQMINSHMMLSAVLVILTLPRLVSTCHEE